MGLGQRRVNTGHRRSSSLPANGSRSNNHRENGSNNDNRWNGGPPRKKKMPGLPVLVILFLVVMLGFEAVRKPDTDYYSSYASSAEELYYRALQVAKYYGAVADDGNTVSVADDKDLKTVPRFHIEDKQAIGLGSNVGPVLLEGWSHDPADWSQDKLMARAGEYPQYLKDLTVQPLKRTSGAATAKEKNSRNLRNKIDDDDKGGGGGGFCVLKGKDVANLITTNKDTHDQKLLFFTNNKENEPFMKELRNIYEVPAIVKHIKGFEVFSAIGSGNYHSIHAHGESWLGQVTGRRVWWFAPPNTSPKPDRVDACKYLTGEHEPPAGAQTTVQNPGEIIWFPKGWLHATCALDDWTVGIGAQQGATIRQNFPKLTEKALKPTTKGSGNSYDRHREETLGACLGIRNTFNANVIGKSNTEIPKDGKGKPIGNDKDWKWVDGDLNEYYNTLESQIHDRDPSKVASYAVHRWMGPKRSTEEHYELIDRAVAAHHPPPNTSPPPPPPPPLKVFDAGCGLGSALMFFEDRHPEWDMTGHTISEEQHKFTVEKLPEHRFRVNLRSYDEFDPGQTDHYDVIYSIEALIHSTNIEKTMREWAKHLAPGGIIVVIDDYVAEGVDKESDTDLLAFAKSWLANVLITPTEYEALANANGLTMVENRDLLAEYDIIKRNYRNQKPDIKPIADRDHQGWMGSKWRQRLTVEGKLIYNMIVLQKPKNNDTAARRLSDDDDDDIGSCPAVPSANQDDKRAVFTEITPQLMSGRGKHGGEKMACISGWYCCNKGHEWFDHLDDHRTDNTKYLKLDRNLFGHYIDVFAKHLNEHYETYPETAGKTGRFLDIGGTGSTASGMTQVTSKFQHFAGPLEYWILDSDPAAEGLDRTLFCDIDDCPSADTCGFDVTFSHTVLEHAKRPWKSFDTIARITKKGGLTMHLVPWSYQYHATPDDNYRFSHKALITLLEDRGFDVLEVGYDICTKPENMRNRIDEHYDTIWLTYVVGRKR